MKVYKYVPKMLTNSETKGEYKSPFVGYVEIEIPTYKERLELIKGMKLSDKVDEANLDSATEILDIVEKRIKKVALKAKNGEKVECLEDVLYYQDGQSLLLEIGKIVMQGIPL